MATKDFTPVPRGVLPRYRLVTHWMGRSPVILPFMCAAVPRLRDEQRVRAALAVLKDALSADEQAVEPLALLQDALMRYTAASHTALAWLARIADETSINKQNRS